MQFSIPFQYAFLKWISELIFNKKVWINSHWRPPSNDLMLTRLETWERLTIEMMWKKKDAEEKKTWKFTKVGHVAKDGIMSPPTPCIKAVKKMNEKPKSIIPVSLSIRVINSRLSEFSYPYEITLYSFEGHLLFKWILLIQDLTKLKSLSAVLCLVHWESFLEHRLHKNGFSAQTELMKSNITSFMLLLMY